MPNAIPAPTDDTDLAWMPAWRLRELMVDRAMSPVAVVRHTLERIDRLDGRLHTMLTVARDEAVAVAEVLERDLAAGRPPGPLFGVPITLKDNLWTRGIRTTAGSLVYRDHVPLEDSVYAERVRRAGAVIIGKTNTPEFALFPRTVNRLMPECVNPWDLVRTCGGSSGGAAAGVAAGITPIAVGSDGGGSIRIPAALCGVFGLHPSNGRVPRYGSFGGTLFFSGVGPIARDARDAAVLLGVLAGPDPRDPTCMRDSPPDYLAALDQSMAGMRMLWIERPGDVTELDPEVLAVARTAAMRFAETGAAVDRSPKPLGVDEWFDAFYTIMDVDRYAALGQRLYEDPSVRGLLSDYAREHFSRARTITAVEYARAMQTRFRMIHQLEQLLEGYDVALSPTVGIVAPVTTGPIKRPPLVAFTFFVNYAGYTAATIPCGFVGGMPVGLQVIGRPNREDLVLQVGRTFERLQPWATLHPPHSA